METCLTPACCTPLRPSTCSPKEGDQDNIPTLELEQQFHALRRLVASKAGYSCFTSLLGFRDKVGWKVAMALKRNDDGISHAAIDMLCALMEPMHQDYDLCAPYSETTEGQQFDTLLEKVVGRGRALFRLFQHPSLTIVMKAIIEEGKEEIGAMMLSLAEGALPQHLLTSLFTNSEDKRLLITQ
jgi:DnaJ family protein C protein 13